MNEKNSKYSLFNLINESTTCYEFLKSASSCVPFKGVGFVEVPEILPAKVDSKFVFNNGVQTDGFEFFLCDSVRRSLGATVWNPDNFLIDPTNLDNQEVISSFGIKVLVRIPIFIDCNTIIGILYFAHDEEIKDNKEELFTLVSAIGSTFSRIFFREFGCDLPGRHSEVNLLKKMVDSNHDLISSVIHDLSNPLTVIYFETQKALGNQDKDISKSLNNIDTSIELIYKIIDSTKKFFSKNKEKEDLETLEIKDVVDFISDKFSSQLLEKKIKFESSGLDYSFIAFRNTFFNTIMGSLISNSIRFSHENATIKLYGREVDKKIEIVLEDEAGGFPDNVLENLASNFKSVPRPSTNGELGSGMGLVLAKSYLQIMNGALSIESLENGSRIILKMSK